MGPLLDMKPQSNIETKILLTGQQSVVTLFRSIATGLERLTNEARSLG